MSQKITITSTLTPNCILTGVTNVKSIDDVILLLVDHLVNQYSDLTQSRMVIVEKVRKRERQMTTCLEEGFAIPHACGFHLKKNIYADLALVPMGTASLDGKTIVYCVVLFITSEPGRGAEHLTFLSSVAKTLSDPAAIRKLSSAPSPEQAYDLLKGMELKL